MKVLIHLTVFYVFGIHLTVPVLLQSGLMLLQSGLVLVQSGLMLLQSGLVLLQNAEWSHVGA